MKSDGIATLLYDTVPSQTPAFYRAIGHAITTWQSVEVELCSVFCNVSTARDPNVGAAIFFSAQDFSDKLNMTRSAARITLRETPLLEEFLTLRKRMINASELRNALAHFQMSLWLTAGKPAKVQVFFVSDDGAISGPISPQTGQIINTPSTDLQPTTEPSSARIMLQPNSTDPNEKFKASRDRQQTKRPMGTRDIIKLIKVFDTLANDLRTFSGKIPQSSVPQKE
jgi:hypothetical protein